MCWRRCSSRRSRLRRQEARRGRRRVHAALQRQGLHRLESARGRQRPLEGSSTASSITTPRARRRRQEPVDARGVRRLHAAGRLADQGDALHEPNVPIIRPTARTRRTPTARRSRSPCPTPIPASTCAARQGPGEHLVLADRLGRGVRLPHGREDAAGGARRRHAEAEGRPATSAQWNTFEITMSGNRLDVVLNGEQVIGNAELPGVPAEGTDRAAAPRREEGRRVDARRRAWCSSATSQSESCDEGALVRAPPSCANVVRSSGAVVQTRDRQRVKRTACW